MNPSIGVTSTRIMLAHSTNATAIAIVIDVMAQGLNISQARRAGLPCSRNSWA
jgi:hypothetical protein